MGIPSMKITKSRINDPSYTVGGNYIGTATMGNSMEIPWKTKKKRRELSYELAILLPGIYPEKSEALIWKDTHTPVFIAVLFTIAKMWKQPKCPTAEWTKKMWCIYIHIYILFLYSFPLWFITEFCKQYPVPYIGLFIHSKCSSLHLPTPNSQDIPPFSLLPPTSLFSIP